MAGATASPVIEEGMVDMRTVSARVLPGLLLCLVLSPCVKAADQSVSYRFGESPLPGIPQTGEWTNGDNWSPNICVQFGEGGCTLKGYPGQQPANATEYVFHKATVSPTPTTPPGPVPVDATLNLGVAASVAELIVGAQTTLNVGGQLGLNYWDVSVVGPSVEWNEAVLEVSGRVAVGGRIFSNGIAGFIGPGTIELLGGDIDYVRLSNAARITGSGAIAYQSAAGLGFSNSGTIDANLNGLPIVLDVLPSPYTTYNAGALRASNGGRLRLQGGISSVMPAGFLNNAAGTIAALDGSLVELYSVDIDGGTLASSGSGRIRVTALNVRMGNVTLEGLLEVDNGQWLTLDGSVVNNGTIRLDVIASNTELHLAGATGDDYSLGGDGILDLTHATRAILSSPGGGPGLVNGPDHTVRGAGRIEQIRRLSNYGLIEADVAGNPLQITAPTGGTLANAGALRARNGGTLAISGFDALSQVPFNNSGGIIEAQDDSQVTLRYATLTGGTLHTTGSGVIRLPASVTAIGGLENSGTLEILGNTTLLPGTIVNDGIMRLGSGSSGASLSVSQGVVLAGGGTLALSNSSANQIASAGPPGTLVNEVGHTIQGAGAIGAYGMALTNRGLIQADQSNALVLADFGLTAAVTNEGTLRAAPGSTLQINQALTNFDAGTSTLAGGRYEVFGTMRLPVAGGIVRNAADIILDGAASRLYDGSSGTVDALASLAANLGTGRIDVRNGRTLALGLFSNAGQVDIGTDSTLTATTYTQSSGVTDVAGALLVAGTLALDGGTVTGSGTVAGNLLNNGNIAPGNSPGVLTLTGDYTQETGVLEMELGQFAYDQLVVSGSAALGGTLSVGLWAAPGESPFMPAPGQYFDLLLAEVISGQFTGTALPAVAGIGWHLQYLSDVYGATDVVRLTASPVPLPPALWLASAALALLSACGRRTSHGCVRARSTVL